jgi:hypothetical protein
MPGIMSGLEPVRLKDGGFPDLTGDGKVTRADILKGRGVEGFAEGGDAGESFYNLQKTAPGSGANLRDVTDFLFDPTDPVDYLVLVMMAFPPAGIAAKLIQAGVKGNKLKSTCTKVEAAKGLTLGPTREGVKGKAGQLLLRQEMADLIPHNRGKLIPGIGGEKALGREQYSYEMRDYLKENPDETYEGGLPELIKSLREASDIPKEFYELAQSPVYRERMLEEVKGIPSALVSSASEADYSRYNPLDLLPESFTKRPSEIQDKADGGIMMLAKGGDVLAGGISLGRAFLNKVKKNPKLQNKDGSPKKSTKEYKDEVKKQQEAKKAETAKKRAETRRSKQEAQAREEAERQARLSRAEAARSRTGETPQQRLNSQSAQADVGPTRPMAGADGPIPSQGPTIASRVDDSLDASKQASAAKKADDVIPPGDAGASSPGIIPYISPNVFNPATKARGTKTIAGIIAGASLLPEGDGSEKDRPLDEDTGDGTFVTGDGTGGGTTPPPVTDNSLMFYMKKDLSGKGFDFDPQTQTFTGDKKPSFFDYVKSLPAGYMEKVSDDPDYAKKMMAGFLNMMKPVEGYVPINPAVAFGEGYLGEETRQADMLPADAKLLEYFRNNPEAYERMLSLEGARAGTIGDADPKQAQEQYDALKRSLMGSKFNSDDYPNLEIRYKHSQYGDIPVTTATLMAMRSRGEGFFGDPNLYLVRK